MCREKYSFGAMKYLKGITGGAFALLILFGFMSCSSGEEVKLDTSFPEEGPEIEVNVIEFNQENSLTRIEIINRMEIGIDGLRGRLVFLGEDGEQLTTATGRGLDSPFSMSANPYLVGPNAKQVKKLGNKIPEGTASLLLTELEATTENGNISINLD